MQEFGRIQLGRALDECAPEGHKYVVSIAQQLAGPGVFLTELVDALEQPTWCALGPK